MTGIICVNKDKDITSFGTVAKIRGIVREKKAGHTGTLDPMATGVLPVMLGGATKFLNYLPDSDKGYRAAFVLGKTTDTLDITGEITGEYEVRCGIDEVDATLDKFRGKIMQLPPMYSAVSVNGQRLYDLARQGVEIEREERRVDIKRLELVRELCNQAENTYVIDVLCSKGTYIRTLVDDIGRELGCGAVMTSLVRTQAMGFTLSDCVTLDELQRRRDNDIPFDDIVINVEKMFKAYKRVYVSANQAKRFSNGGALDLGRIKNPPEQGICRVCSPNGEFLGLGECDKEKKEISVKRLLVRRD